MNTCIVYETTFGNTEQIAKAIAYVLRESGRVQLTSAAHTHALPLEGVDLLILGCPTHRRRPTRAMRALLNDIPVDFLSQKAIACFDTRLDRASILTGSAAERMAKKLRQRGACHLLPPKSFFVEEKHGPLEHGEVEQALNWASLMSKYVNEELLTSSSAGQLV